MSIKYKCHRCYDFCSTSLSDIKKHLNRKYICCKTNKSLFLSNDQILCLSLLPYYNNIHSVESTDIEHLKFSNIMESHKNNIFDTLN